MPWQGCVRVFNAIFYVVKGGIQWRMLQHEFPKWQTVYYYYNTWRKNG
ncbi:MAG: transposase [Chloroflexota bacterium]